jgi:ATP-dependent exoDNAse (exonuclease V) beta subunit
LKWQSCSWNYTNSFKTYTMSNGVANTPAILEILNASAGAGKTFSLVHNYLTRCLKSGQPDYFREILAITFTNKAAHEMKDRVLQVLAELAQKPVDQVSMGPELLASTGLTPNGLQERSGKLLKRMLHDYALLAISTIDHFNHRLIRTFSLELQLAANFNLELDTDAVYQAVADNTIDQLGEDEYLTHTVLDYVESQLIDNKPWDVRQQLKNAVKLMLNEKSIEPLESIRKLSESELDQLRKSYQQYLRSAREGLIQIGSQGLEVIGRIPFEDFKNGNRGGVPDIFSKWAKGEIKVPGSYFKEAILNQKWVAAKKQDAHILEIAPQLTDLGLAGLRFFDEEFPVFKLKELILRNFWGISLSKKLSEIYEAYKEQENLLPISEFNQIIHREVAEQPAPFIYERIGERFKHYFIDEFQDTSLMQWGNLRPLVRHAIASGGTGLLVGDPKQSIYRWRGGEVRQFVDLFNDRDPINKVRVRDEIMETFPIITRPLEDNYRSRTEIIDFNNNLYKLLSQQLQNPDNRKVYAQAFQNPKKGPGGLVYVERVPSENIGAFREIALDKAYQAVLDLLDQGFAKKDITLLVRKNGEGRQIVVNFAAREQPIPVISSESLTLAESDHANLLANLIGLLLKPSDLEIRFQLLTWLTVYRPDLVPEENRHAQLFQMVQEKPNQFMRRWVSWFPDWQMAYLQSLSPVDLVETLMRMFDLADTPDAFVLKFLNLTHQVAANKDASPAKLLEAWEREATSLSVSPPDHMDAVRVMTIHKAKGLQFPVVMMPFTEWEIGSRPGENIWVPVDLQPLEYAYLPISKTAATEVGGLYQDLVEEALEASLFDALNMLYVATTRPVERLYVWTPVTNRSGISKWFGEFWEALGGESGMDTLQLGEATPGPGLDVSEVRTDYGYPVHRQPVSALLVGRHEPTLRNQPHSEAVRQGRLVHLVLEHCLEVSHLHETMDSMVLQGFIRHDERDSIAQKAEEIFNHLEFKNLYTNAIKQWSERPLLIPDGETRRPDRIFHMPDGSWAVLDFKTGQPASRDQAQVRDYIEQLQAATGQVVEGYLLYISDSGVSMQTVRAS